MLPPDMAGGLHLSDPDERRCVLQMLGALCPVQRISGVSLWVGLVWEHRHLLPLAHGDSGHCPSGASIHIGRQRRRSSGNILVAELRAVNFIDALVAILTLQNPLIVVSQSAADENAMLPVSSASSAMIYVVIVSINVRMLRKGLRQPDRPACGQQT